VPKSKPAPTVGDRAGSPEAKRSLTEAQLRALEQGRRSGKTGRKPTGQTAHILGMRVTPDLRSRFDAAKGPLSDSDGVRQALEYAFEHGWKPPEPQP